MLWKGRDVFMDAGQELLSQYDARQQTFFDLLAVLCYAVHSQPKARQNKSYQCFTTRRETYYNDVRTKFPFLSSNHSSSVVYYYDLTPEYAAQILAALNSASSDSDWAMVLTIIEAMDRLLELKENINAYLRDKKCPIISLDPSRPGHHQVSQHYYRFDALNPATVRYGLLLPRESCQWQRPGNRSMDSVSLRPLSVMKNYLWVRPDTGYQIINLYTDFKLDLNHRLKLVTSPLGSQAPFLLHLQHKSKTFQIEYLDECVPTVTAHAKKALDISSAERAHIAMFPEIVGPPASVRECAAYVQSNWNRKTPHLVLLPTCEYKGAHGWVNELTALDGDGRCIFQYRKQHPFRLELKSSSPGADPAYPDIFDEPITADHTIYILHAPGIGRIGFLICSDVFQEGYLDCLTQDLKVTLLLHIAFSPGEDLLDRMLSTAKRDMCDVVICNTCAAWDNPLKKPDERPPVKILNKPIVNIYYPYGHNYNRPQPPPVTCSQPCAGCAFVVEIANKYSGRTIKVNHRYE